MDAVVLDATAEVETVKVPAVEPAAMVTEAGTVAEVELLLRATVRPPVGAAALMDAVPVEEVPPVTLVGARFRPVRVGAVMVKVAVAEAPFAVAVIVELVLLATPVVVTEKVPLVAPAATVIEAGTVAEVELLLRETANPPVGAAVLKVTVPVEDEPPATLVGLKASEDTVGAVMVKEAV